MYRPEFPERFGSPEDARAFCQTFFTWYNENHRHSGIGFHTPADVHFGRAALVRRPPVPPELPGAVWINKPSTTTGEEGTTTQ